MLKYLLKYCPILTSFLLITHFIILIDILSVKAVKRQNISIFIISFNGGQVYTATQKIDISNNFSTYWEIDSDLLKPKSLSGTRKLSIHKIGEI